MVAKGFPVNWVSGLANAASPAQSRRTVKSLLPHAFAAPALKSGIPARQNCKNRASGAAGFLNRWIASGTQGNPQKGAAVLRQLPFVLESQFVLGAAGIPNKGRAALGRPSIRSKKPGKSRSPHRPAGFSLASAKGCGIRLWALPQLKQRFVPKRPTGVFTLSSFFPDQLATRTGKTRYRYSSPSTGEITHGLTFVFIESMQHSSSIFLTTSLM